MTSGGSVPSRCLRSTILLSWVLWTMGYSYNIPYQEHWSLVRGYETFDGCKLAATREAEQQRKAHTFPPETVSHRRSVSTTTTGATFSAGWQTPEQKALVEKEKRETGVIVLGGTGINSGVAVMYECWPNDVDRNHLSGVK